MSAPVVETPRQTRERARKLVDLTNDLSAMKTKLEGLTRKSIKAERELKETREAYNKKLEAYSLLCRIPGGVYNPGSVESQGLTEWKTTPGRGW